MKAYITIKLFATLKKYLPASAEHYPINPGVSVDELLDELLIPVSLAKLIFINGKKGDSDTVLNGGDRIGIFPPVGGG
ncbi:MoaD/ThiS family protein [Desulfococcaceae bacterium HSG7]|nr:MoaD/ThiS family protein [Desulfococcaceae bacterium HSG9]MDM8554763.1 MoaD/ThiS family protein [Desulfococcaceae bacterium HSG7]